MFELSRYCAFLMAFYLAPERAQETERQLFAHVEYLASETLAGRAPQTRGDTLAREYIVQQFRQSGLQPLEGEDFCQSVQFEHEGRRVQTCNLVAATGRRHKQKVLLCAHYDHLGYGETHSLEIGKRAIHAGADDNASGVALMLQLARTLSAQAPCLPFDLVFVAFGGHEWGLHGSRQFVSDWQRVHASDTILWALHFDMVGRMDERSEQFFFRYSDTSDARYTCLLDSSQASIQLQLKPHWGKLDHSFFTALGVATGTFSTGAHADYHRTSDTAQRINRRGLYLLWRFLQDFIGRRLAAGGCASARSKSQE